MLLCREYNKQEQVLLSVLPKHIAYEVGHGILLSTWLGLGKKGYGWTWGRRSNVPQDLYQKTRTYQARSKGITKLY